MMDHVDWAPKGGDGASANAPTDVDTDDAISTFVKVAMATAVNARDTVEEVWTGFVRRVGDKYNPYAVWVQGGIVCTAVAVRAYCGDPDPSGPPSGDIDVMAMARSVATGDFLDLDAVEVAGTVISYACNWEWDKLDELMTAKVAEASDSEFLQELGDVLTQVFIGVGGVGSFTRP